MLVLRDKVLKPLLAASTETYPAHGAQNPRNLDRHYEAMGSGMPGAKLSAAEIVAKKASFGSWA